MRCILAPENINFISLTEKFLIFRTGKLFNDYYDMPWCRIGPYVVGFFAGYILYRTECKLKMPKVLFLYGHVLERNITLKVLSASIQFLSKAIGTLLYMYFPSFIIFR